MESRDQFGTVKEVTSLFQDDKTIKKAILDWTTRMIGGESPREVLVPVIHLER